MHTYPLFLFLTHIWCQFVFTKLSSAQRLAATRAAGEYLFSDIRFINVTVMNTFNRVTTELKDMKVTYKEDSKKNEISGNPDNKYMDIGVATCDSAVWLPAGTYQVVAYTTYTKSGSTKKELETQPVRGEPFVVKDPVDRRC